MTTRWSAAAAFLVVGLGIAVLPALAPTEDPLQRFLLALAAVCALMKWWDLWVTLRQGRTLGGRELLAFIANPWALVMRRRGLEPQPRLTRNLRDLGFGLVAAAMAYFSFGWLQDVDWSGLPFALEHSAKALVLFGGGVVLIQIGVTLVRLAGGYVIDPHDGPFLARTPADFWRRYNRLVGEWLREDCFTPAGGRRHPMRGTLIAFAVSAVIHEYLFVITLGEVQGWQLAFFMVQGLAVAATLRVRPTGMAALAWGLGTLVFNLATALLFTTSVAQVIPLYSGGLPWVVD